MLSPEHSSSETWSPETKLFQPLTDQILLHEDSHCRSVQAFLNMCYLPFTIERRVNAEHMSPSGQIPFIKCGSSIEDGFEKIVQYVDEKGYSLSKRLDEADAVDMKAYMNLFDDVMLNAEYYICWLQKEIVDQYTRPKYNLHYPWPLNVFLFRSKRKIVENRLKSFKVVEASSDKVFADVENCLAALSELLVDHKEKQFFYGSKPTEFDALVYGHISAILDTQLPNNRLRSIINNSPLITDLCYKVEEKYFKIGPKG